MHTERLACFGGDKALDAPMPHCPWPIITDAVRNAVLRQLDASISLYKRSGVFLDFETKFAAYHGRKHALLNNSGTSALLAAYEALGITAGDEVICPTYTFFATASPMMYLGARPVFCDATPSDGNIDPDDIERKITARTRAIVVTHMWGVPCDMERITAIAQRHGIPVIEDCSHAHGASVGGRKVGTFGDVAAWSLQGQKTITGGEGGVLATDSDDAYYRALALGHYNKRCLDEIPHDHDLRDFAVTGLGQKFRAHPLAIAIANEQFDHLDAWVAQRDVYARAMNHAFADIPFLALPDYPGTSPSWYAYVLRFDVSRAHGFSREQFVDMLKAEGLAEVDIPASTAPIHRYELFRNPHRVLPRFYTAEQDAAYQARQGEFPNADAFYAAAIKLPMWVRPEDQHYVDGYIRGMRKVADYVMSNDHP
jgi:dTDP-4-amino-4,6-dideoxygalactose transaminase